MKRFKYIFLLFVIWIAPFTLKADVIYEPYTTFGLVLSCEGIGSYEIPMTELNTISFWGGLGGVTAIGEFKYPAFGTEIAFELRQYFIRDKFKGFNMGFYSGFAFMRYPHLYHGFGGYKNSFGFVPGIKLTQKVKFNDLFMAEPYLSISTPMYSDDPDNMMNISTENIGMIFTIGLRVGINKIK